MRFLSRSRLLALARALTALLLFTQFALSAQACASAVATPATAFAQMPGCHSSNAPTSNACLAHCVSHDQTLNALDASPALAPHLVALFVVPPREFPIERVSRQAVYVPAASGDPPIPIRFLALLN